eukprot:scaffold94921_cov39-Phaeocystis_antarctica.AAC.1
MAPPTKPDRDDPEDAPEDEDEPKVAGGHYPPPPPPPDTWDHVADAGNEAPPPSWRWTGDQPFAG